MRAALKCAAVPPSAGSGGPPNWFVASTTIFPARTRPARARPAARSTAPRSPRPRKNSTTSAGVPTLPAGPSSAALDRPQRIRPRIARVRVSPDRHGAMPVAWAEASGEASADGRSRTPPPPVDGRRLPLRPRRRSDRHCQRARAAWKEMFDAFLRGAVVAGRRLLRAVRRGARLRRVRRRQGAPRWRPLVPRLTGDRAAGGNAE